MLQYYSESRKAHDAQMEDKPDAAGAADTPNAQAVNKLPVQDGQAGQDITPIRQAS